MPHSSTSTSSLFSTIPFLKIWLVALVIKVLLAGVLPLSADEAYYWVWSKHLQLSYYDHPPMAGWLFWMSSAFEPLGQLVRIPFVLLGHLTLWIWLIILKDQLSTVTIKWWLVLALFSPLIGFGSLIATPDVPVVFFWSLALYYLLRVFNDQKASSYVLLGASLGLGFLSKYHIVLFVPVLLAYLTFERRWQVVRWRFLPLLVVAGLIFSLPVLLWNYQNDWVSFAFQLDHGLGKSEFNWQWPLEYLAGMLLVVWPPILYLALTKKNYDLNLRLFQYFAWGPLLFFLFTSFRGSVELNWPVIALPSLFVLAAQASSHRNVLIKSSVAAWGLAYLLAIAVFTLATYSPLTKYLERLDEIAQFEPLVDLPKKYQPLYASTYQMASKLWYENKVPIYKLRGINRIDFYDFQEGSNPSEGPFYVILRQNRRLPSRLRKIYTSQTVEEVGSFKIVEVTRL